MTSLTSARLQGRRKYRIMAFFILSITGYKKTAITPRQQLSLLAPSLTTIFSYLNRIDRAPLSTGKKERKMSDPKNPNIKKRSTPQWALYQRENFWKLNDGEVPPFNTGESRAS